MSTDGFNNQSGSSQNSGGQPDELGVPLTIVSFCIPLVGAILYFTNKDKFPQKAKTAGIAALVGFGLGLVSNIVVRVLMG
jgi:predicted cation transporter